MGRPLTRVQNGKRKESGIKARHVGRYHWVRQPVNPRGPRGVRWPSVRQQPRWLLSYWSSTRRSQERLNLKWPRHLLLTWRADYPKQISRSDRKRACDISWRQLRPQARTRSSSNLQCWAVTARRCSTRMGLTRPGHVAAPEKERAQLGACGPHFDRKRCLLAFVGPTLIARPRIGRGSFNSSARVDHCGLIW